MSEQNQTIIEINGVKMSVDLSKAKVISEYKVGDYVKILLKEYGENYKTYLGNIIAFDNYATTPTIVIAYVKAEYNSASIEYVHFNKGTKNIELTPLNDWDVPLRKSIVMEQFNKEILKKEQELKEMRNKAQMFEQLFAKWFDKDDHKRNTIS